MEGQESEALQEHQNTCKEVQAHPKPLHPPRLEGRLPLHGVHRVTPERDRGLRSGADFVGLLPRLSDWQSVEIWRGQSPHR